MKSFSVKYPGLLNIIAIMGIIDGVSMLLRSRPYDIIAGSLLILLSGLFFFIRKKAIYILYTTATVLFGTAFLLGLFLIVKDDFTVPVLNTIIFAAFLLMLIEEYRYIYGRFHGTLEAKKLFKKAIEAEKQCDYDTARKLYMEIIDRHGNTRYTDISTEALEYLEKNSAPIP